VVVEMIFRLFFEERAQVEQAFDVRPNTNTRTVGGGSKKAKAHQKGDKL